MESRKVIGTAASNRAAAMSRFSVAVIAALALIASAATSALAQQVSGKVFTTDSTCTAVNENIYPSKDAVFINGGPDRPGAAALPDGFYHVQVTTPDGTLLGTSLGSSNARPVQVINGAFVQCYQISSILIKASNGSQGYDDTTNHGGEYKVWVSQDSDFPNNRSKTDNFKVRLSQPPPSEGNHPPVISVPGPQLIQVGATLNFTVTASDKDGDAVTIMATSVPANASFSGNTRMFTFTPVAIQAGQVFVVTFTATDTKGASASGTVQITVTMSGGGGTPGAPIISLPPGSITTHVGESFSFTVIVTGRPNCPVNLTVSGLPDNATFDPATGTFTFTPSANQKGRLFTITFTGTDCNGQSSTARVNIIVVDASGGGGSGGGSAGPGIICIPVTKIFFETAEVNSTCGFMIISISNKGEGALRINSISFENGTNFRVEGVSNLPATLQSAGRIDLRIVFDPRETGTLLDTLVINTDDPEQPRATIKLRGKAKNK